MSVWGRSFIEIENEWTDDQFIRAIEMLGQRRRRENPNSSYGGHGGNSEMAGNTRRTTLSAGQFLERLKKDRSNGN